MTNVYLSSTIKTRYTNDYQKKRRLLMGEIHLSDAEWEIMNCLWNKPNQKISEIVIALSEKKAWDKHTVITLLNRMEKKGAVSFERNGRAKEYYPLISQKETVKQETEQFFERVCQGSLRLMVNSFLSSKAVKKEDLDELYRMLDEAREGKE